jgi:hypothetical protein
MSKRFSTADVAAHKTADDLYIIVDEDVYDLTKFADEHPGGKKSMCEFVYHIVFSLKADSPHPRRWQGCVEAILEVPQREHSQEVPETAASRVVRHESCTSHTPSNSSSPEEGDC